MLSVPAGGVDLHRCAGAGIGRVGRRQRRPEAGLHEQGVEIGLRLGRDLCARQAGGFLGNPWRSVRSARLTTINSLYNRTFIISNL